MNWMLPHRCSLGKLQMQRVYSLQDLLSLVHALPPLLSQVPKPVPLVADLLATLIDCGGIPIVKGVQFLGDCSNLKRREA